MYFEIYQEGGATLANALLGAYGHSHFREAMLGGTTQDLIDRSPVPLLLAH